MASQVRRVRAKWSGLAGGPYLSTWYFLFELGDVTSVITNVRKFLTDLAPVFASQLSVSLEPDQMIFDEADGHLVGVESDNVGAAIVGTAGPDPLPMATQGVIRLTTGGIVNSRRVRGRFFVPGPVENNSTNGVPVASYLTAINGAANTLRTTSAGGGDWCVYSRPLTEEMIPKDSDLEPRPGSAHSVEGVSGWSNWGVQRKRRD